MAESDAPAPLQLTPFQRKHLRKLAEPLEPVGEVGAKGVTKALATKVKKALAESELAKIRLVDQDDEVGAAEQVAAATQSTSCGVSRHVALLYRPDPKKPRIELPAAEKHDQPWRKSEQRRRSRF